MATALIAIVRQTTGSIAADVPDTLVFEALLSAQGFVLASLPMEILTSAFRGLSTVSNDGNGIDITGEVLIGAERALRNAELRPIEEFYAEETAVTSLHKATTLFPKAYIRDNKLFIKPDPDEAPANGYAVIAKDVALSTVSTTFLGKYEGIGLDYARYVDYMNMSTVYASRVETDIASINTSGYIADFIAALPVYIQPGGYTLPEEISLTVSLPTVIIPAIPATDFSNFTDAMATAEKFVTEGLTSTGTDVTSAAHSSAYWVEDEDPEMVSTTNQSAQQEVSRASGELNKQKTLIDEYSSKVQGELGRFNADLQKFTAEVGKEDARVNAILKSYSAEVQAETARFQAELAKAKSYLETASALQVTIGSNMNLAQLYSQNGVAMYKIANDSLTSVINNHRAQNEASS